MENSEKRLTYTVEEAADVLGISRNLAYELIRQGRLPAIRISQKRLVVPKAALAKLLLPENRVPGPDKVGTDQRG